MTTMPAPIRAVQSTGAILLVASVGLLTLTNPVMGLIALAGIGLSALVRLNSASERVTKRRSLTTLWNMFGVYALAMAALCLVTTLAGLLFLHRFFTGPFVLFTLLACWLPFFLFMFNRKGRSDY